MLDLEGIIRRYSVAVSPPGDRHTRPGWTHFRCPYCRGSKHHLGYNHSRGFFTCWSCGWHPVDKTISLLIRRPIREVREIILPQYGYQATGKGSRTDEEGAPRVLEHVDIPSGCSEPLEGPGAKYLRIRGFDPKEIASLWGVTTVKPINRYAGRLMIPVVLQGIQVGWQARTYFSHVTPPYVFPKGFDRTKVVYGLDYVGHGQPMVIVEGVTDVWRLGPGAVATLGTAWTPAQLQLLVNHVQENRVPGVVVLYDNERQATRSGNKLTMSLGSLGVTAIQASPEEGDPADIPQEQVEAFWMDVKNTLCVSRG